MVIFGFSKKKLFGTPPPLLNKPMGFITKLLEKQFKDSPQQSTPNLSLQRSRAAVSLVHALFLLNSVAYKFLNGMECKLFSPTRKQYNNKESLATDLFERLNFEQSFFKTVFLRNSFLQNFIKNNLCKVPRRRARDRDRNPSRPRRDLRPSRPRLQKTGLETRLETETKSRDSTTANFCNYACWCQTEWN